VSFLPYTLLLSWDNMADFLDVKIIQLQSQIQQQQAAAGAIAA
jgi:hypothetical protein